MRLWNPERNYNGRSAIQGRFVVKGFPIILLAAALASAVPATAEEREYIYGAELMSASEREAYRRGLTSASGEEARGQYRQRHRERLQKRAQQRGVQLDEKGIVRRGGGAQ
jgi:hypothetical protein